MGTVAAGETAGAGAVTTVRGGHGRGTRGGVLARRIDEGLRRAQNHNQ